MVDCLTNIRLLRNLRPPVSVYFDKERLDSLDEKAEVFLTMLDSFAQEESRSISTNIKWATRSRMKAGTQKISTTSLLGYDTDDDGEMVIVTNEAEIVRTIYMSFDKGMHPAEIAEKLNALEIRTIKNNPWTGESVKNILRNEKYCGDVLMQKTYTVDDCWREVMEEKIRLAVFGQKRLSREGGIFSAMRVFHKPFISDFPQTSGQAAAGYHAAAFRTPRKAQQHGQLRHHADTPHRKQLQMQADGRPAGPPSYRPVHPRCRPGQGPGCRWDSCMHGHPAQLQWCGNP